MSVFDRLESEVRSYCRAFPTVFTHAEGSTLHAADGTSYLDFFAGAGALNYGHSHPHLRERLLSYIAGCGITHGLDMMTEAKAALLEAFERCILEPRDLRYKVMFPGPTGTNAVEAALKLARKVTGRTDVIAFTNAFHGMTLGALAMTGSASKRRGSGLALPHVTRMPFDGYLGPHVDTIELMEAYLDNPSSGIDPPAAFVVETVQGEGGLNVASASWLGRLAQLARAQGSLLIVDDVQMGCGRVGAFFSFEEAGLRPDIVVLSKSLSGFGLPLSLVLLDPALDVWSPGEHNGTFRGHNLAFVTATAALEHFWSDDALMSSVAQKSKNLQQRFVSMAERFGGEVRGRGLAFGLAFEDRELATRAARAAFERGLLIETSGAYGEVLKFTGPLTISEDELNCGLDILQEAISEVSDDR